jgi:putative sigma-54 modulation protein
MNLQVVGRGCAVTPELRDRTERKLQKLERRLGDQGSAEVTLTSEHNPSIADGQVAEVRVQLGSDTLHVRESASSIEAAIDLAADRIVRAVSRHREQKRRHRPHHYGAEEQPVNGSGDEAEDEADFDEPAAD